MLPITKQFRYGGAFDLDNVELQNLTVRLDHSYLSLSGAVEVIHSNPNDRYF